VHQGAATQREKQHPDEIPVHIVSHQHFNQRKNNEDKFGGMEMWRSVLGLVDFICLI